MIHPRSVLLGTSAATGACAMSVCDHYSGTAATMKKSLALQAELMEEFGHCVLDVTLDCEDGAAVGAEIEHAHLVAELLLSAPAQARTAVRVHPLSSASFHSDIDIILKRAAHRLSHVMLPKVQSAAQLDQALAHINAAGGGQLAIHALVESSLAVQHVFEIAAHPRLQSISFGLMDFVSSHGGAIPAWAMSGAGQFRHPLVMRAKLEIAAACHAFGKTPSHSVFTELQDPEGLRQAARQASQELGFTRMWSIHPSQIRPIIETFAPAQRDIEIAAQIIEAAARAHWAPIRFSATLHDRASYRYFWQVIERAHATGQTLPASMACYF